MGLLLWHRVSARVVTAAGAIVLLMGSASAETTLPGRLSLTEENDYFTSHDDKDYTQGIRVGYLFPLGQEDTIWNARYTWLSARTPLFDGSDRRRKFEWIVVGQNLFTPTVTNLVPPAPGDRPYAAWLYTGGSLLQEAQERDHRCLENLELLVGVIGPLALGGVTQNDFHQFVGVNPSRGWKNQIHNEPGAVVSYERKWKFAQPLGEHLAVEAIPEIGASVGNVFLYGQSSVMFRMGHNMDADYGPVHIRPSLSGTAWFDSEMLRDETGWYLYAGAQSRIVGHNIFLDGNTTESSQNVDKRPFVNDFTAGAALLWSDVRIDFSVTMRTKEFFGQTGSPNRFGSISLSFNL